ncbi:MAG: hypothetical protein FGM16_02870 [Flavobacterium sp.]|nr:hypothetical protein [Flavobacterium sp.]
MKKIILLQFHCIIFGYCCLCFTQNPMVTAAKYANAFDSQIVKFTFYHSKIDNNQVVPMFKTVRK